MTLEIKKLNHSSNPWRLLFNGQEISIPTVINHTYLGNMPINQPICGATRKECTEKAMDLLESFLAPTLDPLKNIPETVQNRVKISIGSILEWNSKVEQARTTDRLFSGGGRYTFEATNGVQFQEPKTISDFRYMASDKGINVEAALKALGYVPPLLLTENEINF